jgi:hypothetical protein
MNGRVHSTKPAWLFATLTVLILALVGCSSTEIIESPKTTFVSETGEAKDPAIIWTSRTMSKNFDYLGQVKSRSLSYESALDRLVEGGKKLRADAIIDVHYEQIGFLATMQAFAIKFK